MIAAERGDVGIDCIVDEGAWEERIGVAFGHGMGLCFCGEGKVGCCFLGQGVGVGSVGDDGCAVYVLVVSRRLGVGVDVVVDW